MERNPTDERLARQPIGDQPDWGKADFPPAKPKDRATPTGKATLKEPAMGMEAETSRDRRE